MVSKIWQWINERIPLKIMLQVGLDEEIPGGASFFYTLGSATLFVFALQVVTGVWQLFYYVPTVDHAYNSLSYLRIFVPYGWLIHGLHYWGGNAMIVLIALHMVIVFVWGAYKKPREITWLIGVFLLFLVIGMSFTGAALPWDERGYWAAEVGTSIASTIPFIGGVLESLLRGGDFMGQLTISRFFILHVAIIPGIAIIIIAAHLTAFRNFGSVGPWSDKKRKTSGSFWPDQVALDIIVVTLILLLLIALSAFNPPPFTGPADPLDTSFTPKPEWNFLFLYETLKFFPGSLEIIGTVGIPTVVVLLLLLVPFLDRSPVHNPLKRLSMIFSGSVLVVSILILTFVGYYSHPPENQQPVKPVINNLKKLSPTAVLGKKVFETYGCRTCHSISGKGGKIGPDLTNEWQRGRSKEWIIKQLLDSKKNYPNSIMPPYTMLSEIQLSDLVDFLLSPHAPNTVLPVNPSHNADTLLVQKPNESNKSTSNKVGVNQVEVKGGKKLGPPGLAADMIGNISHGALLFQRHCESCHGINGIGGVSNPGSLTGKVPPLNPIDKKLFSKNPQAFANNIDRIIQHGSIPAGSKPVLKMYDYGDSHTLTQREITHLEAYILNLNGVNRAQIEETSFSPKQYFIVTAIIFLGVSFFLVFVGIYKKKKSK